jgi:hypothetical protein
MLATFRYLPKVRLRLRNGLRFGMLLGWLLVGLGFCLLFWAGLYLLLGWI